jgi:4-hydroxy-4-methyl-2-oxoglutarate aldolase
MTDKEPVMTESVDAAQAAIKALQDLGTSHVSDAMDRLGIAGQCLGIMPLDRAFRLAGPAFTVRYVPVGTDPGSVGDYIDDLDPGTVVVLDNAGRLDATVWGDLLTATAARRGIGGTVIDGVCRDSDRAVDLGYPVFSRGRWMRTGKDRVRVDGYQVPVTVGGVRVEAGDLLLGDADGVVAIPAPRADEVIAAAERIRDAENRIRADVEQGTTLTAARAKAGYHTLQTRNRSDG